MADDRTPNPRNVTPQKAHPRLLQRIVILLPLPQRLVYLRHRLLKRRKLHHRIRDLPPPQRLQPFVQPRHPFLAHHLPPPFPQTPRIRRQGRLHPHLDRLKRTQRHVRQKLRARRRAQVDERLVRVGEEPLPVQVLEDLVEAVLARALERVADEGRGPAEEDAADAFAGEDGAPGGEVGGVDFGVYLAAAFYLFGFSVSDEIN